MGNMPMLRSLSIIRLMLVGVNASSGSSNCCWLKARYFRMVCRDPSWSWLEKSGAEVDLADDLHMLAASLERLGPGAVAEIHKIMRLVRAGKGTRIDGVQRVYDGSANIKSRICGWGEDAGKEETEIWVSRF